MALPKTPGNILFMSVQLVNWLCLITVLSNYEESTVLLKSGALVSKSEI